MKFKQYLIESDNQIDRWEEYISKNSYLSTAVSILKNLSKNGHTALIVGGAVRDIVMGKKFSDIDISTNTPIENIEKLYKTYDIGKSKDFRNYCNKFKWL